MAVESATYVADLVSANPQATDPLGSADDHLRLLKAVLKATFPAANAALTATPEVLNGLDGRVTDIEEVSEALIEGVTVVPIDGKLEQALPILASAVSSLTITAADRGKQITRTNASAMTDSIPGASAVGAAWFVFIKNIHTSSLLTITPDAGTINGASSLVVYPGQSVRLVSDGTSDYVAVVAEQGRWGYSGATTTFSVEVRHTRPPHTIDCTTGTFTVSTASAASAYGAGAQFAIRNSGTGAITFDPNGSETVDGAATLVINPGETFVFTCDGSNWKTISSTRAVFSAIASKTGNYTATLQDRNKSIRFAGLSGHVTLALPSAASCGDGFMLFVAIEDDVYSVTIDPNSSEQIDGSTTRRTWGRVRLTLMCDGTGWRTVSGRYRFRSDDQDPSTGGALTLQHSLVTRPKLVWGEVRCTSADNGYAVGDIVHLPLATHAFDAGGPNIKGSSAWADTTNVYIKFGNSSWANVVNKSGGYGVLDASKWKFTCYAEE